MIESMTILILFAIYTIAHVCIAGLVQTKYKSLGQFALLVLSGISSYLVVNYFNTQRVSERYFGSWSTSLIDSFSTRALTVFGVVFIITIGISMLYYAADMPKIDLGWSAEIYVLGLIVMTIILLVFPTNGPDAARKSNIDSRYPVETVTSENVLLETLLYGGQSDIDVKYLTKREVTWLSVSEPTTVQEVKWSKQWRVIQGDQVVHVEHAATDSPELRVDGDNGVNNDDFTRWLSCTDEPIRITRVVKQRVEYVNSVVGYPDVKNSKTKDIIVVYYEPINKQVYQQYKATRELDAKVNPK